MQSRHETQAPLRADARRNREQIIEAARELFVRHGPDVPMEEIARSASVGVGTLYRRFPDRDELIKAVSLDNFERLAEVAGRLETDEPDPSKALMTLLHTSLELRLGITMAALSPRVAIAIGESPEIKENRDKVIAIGARLLHKAQSLGTIRGDIDIGDVILALQMVARLIPPTDNPFAARVFGRLVTLMMDGLRTANGTELAGPPVTYENIEELRQTGAFAGFGKPPATQQRR